MRVCLRGAMPELPKPRRVDFSTARRYIKEVCGLADYADVNPAFFDALCNDDVYFVADLRITSKYQRPESFRQNQRIPAAFWNDWGYTAFNHGTLAGSTVTLPIERSSSNPSFYTNLTIETALLDEWLSESQSDRVRVTAVPEKAYKLRIEQATAIGIIYSRGEDREWAKAHSYSVQSVQEMRKKHAPAEWQEAGRRPANNLQKESAN